jgi:hypothetical protein
LKRKLFNITKQRLKFVCKSKVMREIVTLSLFISSNVISMDVVRKCPISVIILMGKVQLIIGHKKH